MDKALPKLKWLVENTDLYILVNGNDPNIVSTWGRAKKIDLASGMVKFSRYEHAKHQMGGWGEMVSLHDCFLSTEVHVHQAKFMLVTNLSKDNGSWQKYKMDDLLKKYGDSVSWHFTYDHVINTIMNRNMFTRLRYKLSGGISNQL